MIAHQRKTINTYLQIEAAESWQAKNHAWAIYMYMQQLPPQNCRRYDMIFANTLKFQIIQD